MDEAKLEVVNGSRRSGGFPPAVMPSEQFPFTVVGKVGEGAMGVVYRAVEPALARTVAIKVLRSEGMQAFWSPGEYQEARLRFLQEARSAAAIQHPGAVSIHRVGNVDGVPYIAMEWLEGETLTQRLQRSRPLPVETAVRFAVQVLDALQAAHEAGVVHRDIKPANLMILKNDVVKVADFGIARLRSASLVETQAGVVFGTPFYASPEQLRGEPVDARSDLYSLAAVLYEMLSGQAPVTGTTFQELFTRLHTTDPSPVRALRSEVPAELDRVILKGLARDRAERWASASAMAAALRPGAAVEGALGVGDPFPVEAGPEDSTLRLVERSSYPVVRGPVGAVARGVARVVRSWATQELPDQDLRFLLAKVLDRPLHAQAFSGGVEAGDTLLLVHDGAVVAAVVEQGGETRVTPAPELPTRASARLYVPQGDDDADLTLQLAAVARGVGQVESVVDAALVNVGALATQLAERRFTGALRLRSGRDESVVLFSQGRPTLGLAFGDWDGVPVDESWSRWLAGLPLKVELVSLAVRALPLTYEVRFRDLELACRWLDQAGSGRTTTGRISRRLPLLSSRVSERRRQATLEPLLPSGIDGSELAADPALVLLRWLLEEAPVAFAKEGVAGRWKYLAEWIPLVATAHLHHDLPAPGTRVTQAFDLVTADAAGKVLHLAMIFDRVDRGRFDAALARALAAKEARLPTGDIGAVLLVAPSFPSEVVEAYLERVEAPGRKLSRLQESLTGYAGFVRVGRNRGFHLLLVEQRESGFEALLE